MSGKWEVERFDLEQPPRLVWWHPEHLDCLRVDVDDILHGLEEFLEYHEADMATLSEQAITELCDIVRAAVPEDGPRVPGDRSDG